MLNLWVNEKIKRVKGKINAYAGKDAEVWVFLYIANGIVNWHDASHFFQAIKVFIPFKPVIPQLLISPTERAKETSELLGDD